VKVDPKDIHYRYRQMSDTELRAIRPNQLTTVGLRCYLDEISSRGFETNQTPSLFDEELLVHRTVNYLYYVLGDAAS
jgi:hypothetical protein